MINCVIQIPKTILPIIEKYKVVINQIMKTILRIPLESISLNYYGYSLLNQDKIYDNLISKLRTPFQMKINFQIQ